MASQRLKSDKVRLADYKAASSARQLNLLRKAACVRARWLDSMPRADKVSDRCDEGCAGHTLDAILKPIEVEMIDPSKLAWSISRPESVPCVGRWTTGRTILVFPHRHRHHSRQDTHLGVSVLGAMASLVLHFILFWYIGIFPKFQIFTNDSTICQQDAPHRGIKLHQHDE